MTRARFGNYEILHELKAGGMGAVLLAHRRGPGAFEQLVAIKTIRPEFAATPAVRAMFLDEAAILARIHHPGIATVHDFGEEGGTLYMVMEYVAGIPFRDIIEHRPPPAVIARAITEACRGLHAAHDLRDRTGALQGLVHRDISPDNLMLGFDGHVKVIDFGIALVKKNRQAPVTEFGTVKGKPPYMSPEQVANEPMDRRSDVFSLGVVLWELLAQKQLFEGDSIYHVAIAVQQQVIVPPSQARGDALPPGLDAVVMAALERDPAKRTPTAAAFAEQLEQVLRDAGGESLEAWAERVLAPAREDHRTWLAGVLDDMPLPKALGRASGQVTELAPIGLAGTQHAPLSAVTPAQVEPPSKTSINSPRRPSAALRGPAEPVLPIGGTSLDELSIPPRNRLAPIALVLLALLIVGGGAVYMATRDRGKAAVVHDAAPVPVVVDAVVVPPADAAVADASVPIDAPPIDAGTRLTVRVPRDAAVVVAPAPLDAAVRPTGTGIVDIKFKEGVYANISIDDGPARAGPLLNLKLPAGKHTIRFLSPEGQVRDTQTVDVVAGEKLTVRER